MSRSEPTKATIKGRPLGQAELGRINAWSRAANYLSVGQIYLMANPLLREELLAEHVKPRLLGPGSASTNPRWGRSLPRG